MYIYVPLFIGLSASRSATLARLFRFTPVGGNYRKRVTSSQLSSIRNCTAYAFIKLVAINFCAICRSIFTRLLKCTFYWFAIPLLFTSLASGASDRFTLKESFFDAVAKQQGIDPLLLYAIAITESATGVGNGNISPSPYVLRTQGAAQFFTTKHAAEVALTTILETTQNVDVGMMQINLRYHPQPNPLDLLDPQHNLTVATRILKKTMASTQDPVLGVGRYHSWIHERAMWYGRRVWQIFENLHHIIAFQ